jgi:hypothetical protein
MTIERVLRRAWVLLVCAVVAGAAAWFLGPSEVVRERQMVAFVLQPNPRVTAGEVPDLLRGTGGVNSQLTRTIGRVIESESFLDAALARARSGTSEQGDYELQSSLEPGTDVITVDVSAKEGVQLDTFVRAYSREASEYVTSVYKAYALEFLEATPAPPGGAGTSKVQITGLAALAGALLGLLLVFAEYQAKGPGFRRPRRPTARGRVQSPREGDPRRGDAPRPGDPPRGVDRRGSDAVRRGAQAPPTAAGGRRSTN